MVSKAKDLYESALFKLSFKYAKKLMADKVFILSAKYGLLDPETVIEPYDMTLNEMPIAEVRAWAERVIVQLKKVADLEEDTFIFLAGKRYRQFLVIEMRSFEVPMERLRIGEQLQFLKERTE